MHLSQSHIRNTHKLLNDIEIDQKFFLGVEISDDISNIIMNQLNISEVTDGQMIYPSPINGIMSERNSVGEFVPQKDKPKETAYRSQSWELTDYGGYSHSGTSYVPYKRYPRIFIEPKELKLLISPDTKGKKTLIIAQVFTNVEDKYLDIIFGANLLLEIFKKVETFLIDVKENFSNTRKIEPVNWEILPKGKKIWESFNSKMTEKLSPSEQYLINDRFEYIENFKPDKVRQGIGGYNGYLIFEFTEKNLFIFDSILYGEAMYIFKDNWEQVSQLTKKEIIQEGLAEERIIHNKYWRAKLNKYIKPK